MSTQIAVRLPDELVADLDALVAAGQAPSRTSIVEQALRRELRRHLYEQEVILLQASITDDFDDLADWNRRHFTLPD